MRIGTDEPQAADPPLKGRVEGLPAGELQPLGSKTRLNGSSREPADGAVQRDQDSLELSPEASEQLRKLKARDQVVRAHEAAHMAAGGALVRGGASYTYQQGPDGRRYAVGGEVSLDASAVPDDPQATILKAERIRAAALAPADPSGQDRAVAAQAAAMASQAATALAKQKGAGETTNQSQAVGSRLDMTA